MLDRSPEQTQSLMQRHRGLPLGAYLVGATLVVIPLFDAMLSISPAQPGDFRWRFGAAGLVANATMIPEAGLLLLLLTAIGYQHTMFRRVLGVLAFVGALACALTIGLFALDALQTRPAVRPEMMTSFVVAGISAIFKLLIAAVTLVVLGIVGVSGSREARSEKSVLMVDSTRVLGLR